MNELTAKVSEPTALQNPTPTELALLKRLEDCAVVMRGMADMMRTTNERMGALEREVRMLTKVTPAQATAINTAIRERAAALCLSYRAIGCEKQAAAAIRKAIRQTSAGAFLALDPDTTQRFLRAVTESAGKYTANTQKPVLMASMDIRRYVRRLIEGEHYGLPVVSYQEVTPEISIQPVSRIRL